MQITVEMLRERLERLRAAAEQVKANLSAYNGAIEDCEHWLAVLEGEKKEDTDG